MHKSSSASGHQVMNLEMVLDQVQGNRQLLCEIAQILLDELPAQLEDLKACVVRGDSESVRRRAHHIKGGAANLGAEQLVAAAFALERAGQAGEAATFGVLVERIIAAWQRLEPVLRQVSADCAADDAGS